MGKFYVVTRLNLYYQFFFYIKQGVSISTTSDLCAH
jgi:hypothetical protein